MQLRKPAQSQLEIYQAMYDLGLRHGLERARITQLTGKEPQGNENSLALKMPTAKLTRCLKILSSLSKLSVY